MTRRILYSELEKQMLRLDDEGDGELADRLRDLMDFVWFQRFSPEDRTWRIMASLTTPGADVADPPRIG